VAVIFLAQKLLDILDVCAGEGLRLLSLPASFPPKDGWGRASALPHLSGEIQQDRPFYPALAGAERVLAPLECCDSCHSIRQRELTHSIVTLHQSAVETPRSLCWQGSCPEGE